MRGPFSRESRQLAEGRRAVPIVTEPPDILVRGGSAPPTTPQRRFWPFVVEAMSFGAPSVLPSSRGFHPLGPPTSQRPGPRTGPGRCDRTVWLRRCRVAVPTLATAQQAGTARGGREVDMRAENSPLGRSAPIPSRWTTSLRSSPQSLLWWLRWQLYSVQPEVRAKRHLRKCTPRYRRSPADDCPPRPPDWWPW